MQHSPMYEYSAAAIPVSGSISLGTRFPVNFSGVTVNNRPSNFSVGGWFRLAAGTTGTFSNMLFEAVGQFELSVTASSLTVTMGSSTSNSLSASLVSGQSFELGQWYFVLVTYNQTGANTGNVCILLDGVQLATGPLTISNSNTSLTAALLGSIIQVGEIDVLAWCIWSATIPYTLGPLVQGNEYLTNLLPLAGSPNEDTPLYLPEALEAAWDFGNGPVTDDSGKDHQVTFNAPAVQNSYISCLNPATTWVFPSKEDTLINPAGGGPTAPWTVQAWVYPQSSGLNNLDKCTLFANTDSQGNAYCWLYLVYNDDNTFTPCVQMGSNQVPSAQPMTTISSPQSIPPNSWHNVAATYDGKTLILYVDGTAVESQPCQAPASLNPAGLMIGVTCTSATTVDYSLNGFLQALGIWNCCLTPNQIQSFMYNDPTGVAGCVGFLPLNSACSYPGSSLLPDTNYVCLSNQNTVTGNLIEMGTSAVIAEQVFPLMISPPSSSDAQAQAAPLWPACPVAPGQGKNGSFSVEREGEEYLFYYVTPTGKQLIDRQPADSMISCSEWGAELGAAGLSLLLDCIGLPYDAGRLLRKINSTKDLPALLAKLNLEGSYFEQSVAIISFFWNLGCLRETCQEALLGNIWDLLWAIGQVTLTTLCLLVPVTTSFRYVVLVASITNNIKGLVDVIKKKKSAGC